MYIDLHINKKLFFSHFNENLTLSADFRKILKCKISLKIRPAEFEFPHANGQMDRHDEANVFFSRA
jgi:hypothetical protein